MSSDRGDSASGELPWEGPPATSLRPGGSGRVEWAHRSFARRLAYTPADRAWVLQLVDFVNARLDLSDHQMLHLLGLLLTSRDVLPDDLEQAISEAVLGFRYDFTEPGRDHMCSWTENHQLLFAVNEYLAGQLFPDEVFTNDGRRGKVKQQLARARLVRWLDDRFHHGFSEWLSGSYYQLMVVGLTVLIDHAHDDEELVVRATMVLDLLMLDMALHRFDEHFVSASGRANRAQKHALDKAEVEPILAAAFGRPPRFDPRDLSSLFLARERYRIPDVITEIAAASGARVIRTYQSRDLDQALADVERLMVDESDQARLLELVRTAWGQQGYVTADSIAPTLRGMERYRLWDNRFLFPLARFRNVRRASLARTMLRALNPIAQGQALHGANVFTYRTPNYLLSSAQHYRPGEFGDQQHLWHAALPNGINVFTTHPGSTQLNGASRPATPGAWVGNGVNPDIGQYNNVVLVLHDLRVRRGFMEGRRHEYSHAWFPFVEFDETILSEHTVAGRTGTALVGMVALERIEMVSQTELVQRGLVTGWALVCADLSEYRSLAEFSQTLKDAQLRHTRGALVLDIEHCNAWDAQARTHEYRLEWRQGFVVDGVRQNPHYWRHDNDWVAAARGADLIMVRGRDKTLTLQWSTATRTER